jgi:transposase
MAGMGDGYVGTAEDSARIRRMDKKRQEQKRKFEEAQKQRQERLEGAGLRKFDTATTEVETLGNLYRDLTFTLKFHSCNFSGYRTCV